MELALKAGLMPDQFWDMTPVEFVMYIDAYTWRRQEEYKVAITQAWVTAALQRSKKMPKLESLIEKTKPKRQQNPEQMLAMVRALNAAFGGEVIEKGGDGSGNST